MKVKSEIIRSFQQFCSISVRLMVFLFVLSFEAFTQNLPSEFRFSTDGLRLIRGNSLSTGFYNPNTIDTLFITFSQPKFWTLLTNNYLTGTDLAAKLVYKKVTYEDIGVRLKGETSYRLASDNKYSFNLTLDYIREEQNIDGYTTLNLNNSAEDRTFMREFLYEYFSRKHIPSVKANYLIVYINGENWGLYVNVQQLNKPHAREWFTDADATRWRAEPVYRINPGTGGGSFGAGLSSMNYLNTLDTTTYKKYYTLKKSYKKNPWSDLVKAFYALNNTPMASLIDSLGKYMDIDATLWFLAHEILFTDDDGYIYKGGTDYYIYFDVATHRIVPIEYDGNSSFNTTKAVNWSPFERETNVSYPLSSVLFKHPELRQRYLAHLRTILNEAFKPGYADSVITFYSKLIDPYVNADPQKLYPYSQFISDVPKLKSFMTSRRTFMLSNTEVKVSGPTIGKVIFKSGNVDYSIPDYFQGVEITASVSGPQGISMVYLYYGTQLDGRFAKLEMLDDGKHNDGGMGDGTYGAEIPAFPKETYVRYYIEAISSNSEGTRSYSPEGAEHDVYIYRVKGTEKVASDVVINELMPSNAKTAPDLDGEYDDWVELYNNSALEINLSGYYLTDSKSELTKWKFPEGTTIKGNSYLIVWADNDTGQNGLHTNYKLDAGGESILLVTPDQQIADEVNFETGTAESTFSRSPDGTGKFVWTTPTYNKTNSIINNINEKSYSGNGFLVFPNPAQSQVTVRSESSDDQTIFIYNSLGAKIFQWEFSEELKLDVSTWSPGIYLVKTSRASKKLVVWHR